MNRRPCAIAALVTVSLALAACGGGGASSSTPTPAPAGPTVPPGALQGGSRVLGDTFTATIPLGWQVKPTTTSSTGVRQTEVDAPGKDSSGAALASIYVIEEPNSIFPAADLSMSLDDFVATVVQLPSGSANVKAVTPRTHIKVAGEDAVILAFQDTFKGKAGFTRLCVFRHATKVYVLTLGTTPTLAASYSPALDTIVGTWAWTS